MQRAVTYLDHAATTPMREEAVAAMTPFLAGTYGNPSGGHAIARAAKTALEEAREEIAALLGAAPAELVFTAGGTEADNLAVKGAARAARAAGHGDGIVTTAFEHKGVLASAHRLETEGFRVAEVGVGRDGIVSLDGLAAALDERTIVVSVMLVNNEVGTVQPLDEIAALVRERAPRAVLHTDAVQAVPWLDVAAARGRVRSRRDLGPQVRGPQGIRSPRRAQRCHPRTARGGWRTRARPAFGHVERGGRRGHRGCAARHVRAA